MANTVAVSVDYETNITVTPTYSGDYISSGNATLLYNGMDESGTLTGATAVPVTKFSSSRIAMDAGAATIDLSALPGVSAEETVDFTGLKVQVMKIRNLSTNANKITLTKGASNGWSFVSTDTWTIPLLPNQSVELLFKDGSADVSAGACEIDLAGTGAQVLEYTFVAG